MFTKDIRFYSITIGNRCSNFTVQLSFQTEIHQNYQIIEQKNCINIFQNCYICLNLPQMLVLGKKYENL